MRLSVEVSAGELWDRITILEIKLRRLPKPTPLDLRRELARARRVRDENLAPSPRLRQLADALKAVNQQLWCIEEELRASERAQRFDDHFVRLARSVYLSNDRRAAIKRAIDTLVGSEVLEHKSHPLPEALVEWTSSAPAGAEAGVAHPRATLAASVALARPNRRPRARAG
jgi:hypothetical protein